MAGAASGQKIPTLQQTSAGGAAFRDGRVVIVSVNPSRRWQLPKGLIDKGESAEQAAVREVREEAGIDTRVVAPIETIEFWYFSGSGSERVRYHKFVHFFLLEYLHGSVADHDHEIAEAIWVTPEQAIQMLAFDSERGVVEKARSMMKERM